MRKNYYKMDDGCDEELSAGRIAFTEILKGVKVVKSGDRSLN
jgi:hypothetical protein